jgi:hypothetical protein
MTRPTYQVAPWDRTSWKRLLLLRPRELRRAHLHRLGCAPHARCEIPHCPHWRHFSIAWHAHDRMLGVHRPRQGWDGVAPRGTRRLLWRLAHGMLGHRSSLATNF